MVTKRYHVIIDVGRVEGKILNDKRGLKTFLKTLPGIIDMHLLTQPVVVSGIPENPGLSGFVIIDYSHISIHTFTNHNEALVDIFSCKPFQQEKAVEKVISYFQIPLQNASIQQVRWD